MAGACSRSYAQDAGGKAQSIRRHIIDAQCLFFVAVLGLPRAALQRNWYRAHTATFTEQLICATTKVFIADWVGACIYMSLRRILTPRMAPTALRRCLGRSKQCARVLLRFTVLHSDRRYGALVPREQAVQPLVEVCLAQCGQQHHSQPRTAQRAH